MSRGVSISRGDGQMECPICGERYKRGSYGEHTRFSSQHDLALVERQRRSRPAQEQNR
jgi:hypothetical protein